jgi:hypothetical protein
MILSDTCFFTHPLEKWEDSRCRKIWKRIHKQVKFAVEMMKYMSSHRLRFADRLMEIHPLRVGTNFVS